jgi:hypothetical protein
MQGDPTTWDVVFFASVDFDTHVQRPQSVARDLAARGARVLYVDNIGLRLPGWRDHRRVQRRLRASLRGRTAPSTPTAEHPPEPGGLDVVSPLLLPLDHWAPVRTLSREWLLRRIGRWTAGSRRALVVWTFLPNPLIADVADALGASHLVYEYADMASVRLHARRDRHRARVARWEQAMFRRADTVFVPTPRLIEARGIEGPNVFVVSHGMPPDGMGHPWPELETVPRPRIAFVGSISPVVDLDLLSGIARARPDWSLVLAGPARVPLRDLGRLPNVRIVGERPQADITALLARCDVGLVPYRLDAAGILTVSPLKLGDYVAAGLPVVTVDLADEHPPGAAITVADGVDGFVAAIEHSLRTGAGNVHGRRAWSEAVGEMVDLIRRDDATGARPS